MLRFDASARGAIARGLHRPTCWSRASARATCWSATTSASAPGAPATTRCSTPPARSRGFDVARMMSYEVHGLRVSSSAVRAALAAGDMKQAEALLGRPYSISGHVLHGAQARPHARRKRRRPRRRLSHPEPALPASAPGGASASSSCGSTASATRRSTASPAWAGGRRSTTAAASCSKRTASIGPPRSAARGATVNSSAWNCLHKLRDEARYDSLEALAGAIRGDADGGARLARRRGRAARAPTGRQTTRDRI